MDCSIPKLPDSPALAHAVAAGLPPRMSYTVSQTAAYTGESEHMLRTAIRNGSLRAKMPNGNLRGARIPVAAVDEWMGVPDAVKGD